MTNLDKAKECVDQVVHSWNRTRLTDIEKWSTEELIIWGVVDLAMYLLSPKDYQALKQYIYDQYGYNVGGAVEKKEGAHGKDIKPGRT